MRLAHHGWWEWADKLWTTVLRDLGGANVGLRFASLDAEGELVLFARDESAVAWVADRTDAIVSAYAVRQSGRVRAVRAVEASSADLVLLRLVHNVLEHQ